MAPRTPLGPLSRVTNADRYTAAVGRREEHLGHANINHGVIHFVEMPDGKDLCRDPAVLRDEAPRNPN